MKTKQEIINEILESDAQYVKTSISTESCAVAIAIRDIQDIDNLPANFEWTRCSAGLDEDDYAEWNAELNDERM
jgi:hypothetical protein